MENLELYVAILLCFLLIFRNFFHHSHKLPPSPLSLPIIGHLHHVKKSLLQTLNSLSSQYGPIVFLRFGFQSMVIVSSPSAIEECFTKNDIVLANRPQSMAGDRLTYNYTAFVWASYGDLWRTLRRLTVVELFSSIRLQKSSIIREEQTRILVRQLLRVSKNGSHKVNLNFYFSVMSFNNMMRMVTGKQYIKEEEADMEIGKEKLKELKGRFFTSISMNMCDFFPILRWFGYKGLEQKAMKLHKNRDQFLQGLIDEFRQKKKSSGKVDAETNGEKYSFIESLLNFQESEPDMYTDDIIKSILLVAFVAGTETSSVTLDRAMSLLLTHPEVLHKLRAELDDNIGHERLLNEMDLPNLPYLRCVINETLRLYPTAPFLLPHCTSEDCSIGGFEIARGTTLIVNAWTLHRDPKVWEEPDKFMPERFEGCEGEREGYKFVPFGVGRRACPGASMGIRIISLALAALIQCFEWEKVGPIKMALSLRSGASSVRDEPLEAACTPRGNWIQLVSN